MSLILHVVIYMEKIFFNYETWKKTVDKKNSFDS